MKKLVFILIFILFLSSCNKNQDLPQEETKFKLKMNSERYVSEADETIEDNSIFDNSVLLKDYHNFFLEVKDEYELKTISVISYEKLFADESNYQSHNCDFTYTLSNERLNVTIDENCVSDANHELVLYLLIEYNGEHNFRIRLNGYKKPDYSSYFRLLMNDKKYVFEMDEFPIPGTRYDDFIKLDDYHNLYFEMQEDYVIENISLGSFSKMAPGPEWSIGDPVQFSYNLTENILNIKIDENYIIDDNHELIISFEVIYNGNHYFNILIKNWNLQ